MKRVVARIPLVAALSMVAVTMVSWAGRRVAAQSTMTTAPMPIDLAFGRHQLAAEDRTVVNTDGTLVAYVVNQTPEKSSSVARFLPNGVPVSALGSRVFLTEISSRRTHPVAANAGNCWRPGWSPDSRRLALYCDKGGMPQVWLYEVTSGQARRLHDGRIKAKLWAGDEPTWSPNGRELFVPLAPPTGSAGPPPPAPPLTKPGRAATVSAATVSVFTTRPQARERTTPETEEREEPIEPYNASYLRENNAALGAIDVATGTLRIVAPANATPPPSVLRVSPSGKWLAYLSVFHKPTALATHRFHDLAVVPAAGGPVRMIAADIQVPQHNYHLDTYVWHPTSDRLVWWKDNTLWTLDPAQSNNAPRRLAEELGAVTTAPLAMTRDGRTVVAGVEPLDQHDYRDPAPQALAIVPLDGTTARRIPLPHGMIFQSLAMHDAVSAWQAPLQTGADDTITIVARESATAHDVVLRIELKTGRVTRLWQGLARLAFAGADPHGIVGVFEDVVTPGDLYHFAADFEVKQRLTNVESRLNDIQLGPVETFETTVPQYDSTLAKVTTAVLLPPGARKGDRLPGLVFLYPGGKVSRAAAEFGGGMPSTVPVAAFTTRGYAVLLVELPISPAGEAGNPVQEMLDVLLPQVYHAAQLGYVDVTRLALSGQSYGAYGTASIVSATTLFRAAIAIAGLYDLPAMHSWMQASGQAGMARWAETGQGRMGTHPWADLPRYLANSPYYRADSIRTPLLLLHGEIDRACPVEEAEKLFNALKRLSRPVELRTYAGEGHVVYDWSRANAIDAVTRMLTFLDEHLRRAEDDRPPSTPVRELDLSGRTGAVRVLEGRTGEVSRGRARQAIR